jgi:hypothetical protein
MNSMIGAGLQFELVGSSGAQRRYMPPVARSAIRLKRLGAAR